MPDLSTTPALAPSRSRRRALTAVAALVGWGAVGHAWAIRPRAEGPTVATDTALLSSGLGARWGQAMQRDLGWAARWQPASTRQSLDLLESGDVAIGLHLSHPRADWLEQEGLIHDRRKLLRTEVWLIGPTSDPAGIRGEKDPARAIAQVLAAQAAGVARWQTESAQDVDGALSALAQGLLGAASAPASVATLPPGTPAYRLVTQAGWLQAGAEAKKGQRTWFQGHPAMRLHAEVARSTRGKHPGARLLVEWLDRPLARQAVRGVPGWQNERP